MVEPVKGVEELTAPWPPALETATPTTVALVSDTGLCGHVSGAAWLGKYLVLCLGLVRFISTRFES
jgi:hypothetical protein